MRLTQLESILAASRFDIGNWLNRYTMTSPFERVSSGKARTLTYQNAIELALVDAFVTAGLTAPRAIAFARPFVEAARGPALRFGPQYEWIAIAGGEAEPDQIRGTDAPEPNFATVRDLLGGTVPTVFALIAIGGIFRRVDALFAEAE